MYKMASFRADAFLFKIIVVVNAVVICTAYVPATLPPDRSVNFVGAAKKLPPRGPGICNLEVPTIDLLTEADRRGPIPAGNGTKPGHSIISICCSGWKPKPHVANKCEPICDNGCVNGNCTAPNVCVCLPGYVRDLGNNCIPTCPKGCVHGVCTLQGTCSCSAGYTLDLKGQFCIPICTGGCGAGGNCTAPNVCSCKPGYKKVLATGKCDFNCEGGCPSGTHCVGPNECSCPAGFIKRNNACEAQCPRGCLNGLCTGPNQCTCPSGWTLDLTGTSCQAHCTQPCLNGDCTGPNVCTCKTGYIKDPSTPAGNRCVAHCPGGCLNGQCSGPNLCICNPGFIKNQGTNTCIRRMRRELHMELIPEQLNEFSRD
uniref:EGF-like domain-containing protein n=1 Tax=Photinus pyralis TaxID=7054 RepID=A0A1Y1L313_PHOPY